MKIEEIEHKIPETLQRGFLTASQVIGACGVLSRKIEQGDYDVFLRPLVKTGMISERDISQAVSWLCPRTLTGKVERELGADRGRIFPLGVLFHINPENVEGIAAYSVIEGLLGGNINLVKLPAGDGGITEFLLCELMKILPLLEEYIYLFAVRSADVTMKRIAALADAVVVWGGDETIRAVREMAAPNQRVIEWGHKISFAYVTPLGMTDGNLAELARHIVETRQMACSSCQGIYLDSSRKEDVVRLCKRMMEFLSEEAGRDPEYDLRWDAGNGVRRYTYAMEHPGTRILRGKSFSLLYCEGCALEPAISWGNIWVKTLRREMVIPVLKKYHGYLQTVGLICGQEERQQLSETLIQAGITNLRGAGDMSAVRWEDSHDGEYALRRYTKVVR